MKKFFWAAIAALETSMSGVFFYTAQNQNNSEFFYLAVLFGFYCALGAAAAVFKAQKKF